MKNKEEIPKIKVETIYAAVLYIEGMDGETIYAGIHHPSPNELIPR